MKYIDVPIKTSQDEVRSRLFENASRVVPFHDRFRYIHFSPDKLQESIEILETHETPYSVGDNGRNINQSLNTLENEQNSV